MVWLEGALATASQLTPTPREIVRRLGADTLRTRSTPPSSPRSTGRMPITRRFA